jgi:predicted HicB family RNase H-like nuclease
MNDSINRTYVGIDPELHRNLKVLAASRTISVKVLVEQALREMYPQLKEKTDEIQGSSK